MLLRLQKDTVKGFHFKIMNMKSIIMFFGILICTGSLYAQPKVNLKILDASKNGGKIYVSVFNSEQSYNKKLVNQLIIFAPQSNTPDINIDLPVGEYVFAIYQDSNDNGKLDCNILGIPKEYFGFSNYDGLSVPGGFQKLKVQINENSTSVVLHLFKI